MNIDQTKLIKPFPSFKWRWMEVTPVESFNRPDIILGITRAMLNCEGLLASGPKFLSELSIIQNDLLGKTNLNIVPSNPSRNVIRRQGRYWRGMGLLAPAGRRSITLTDLGRDLATGEITNDEFVSRVVATHSLPNNFIDKNEVIELWEKYSLKLYPLQIILNTVSRLRKIKPNEGYITSKELCDVIVPLSILNSKITTSNYASAILQYRDNPSCVDHFPNCVEASNDKRMVREHLLFLANYELLDRQPSDNCLPAHSEQFLINEAGLLLAGDDFNFQPVDVSFGEGSGLGMTDHPKIVELGAVRTKRLAEVTSRPNQAKFRKIVLENFRNCCLLTNEPYLEVLNACHIISVKDGGNDNIDNGLCLRADIHKLFDIGKLRICDNGQIILSPDIANAPTSTYRHLPSSVQLPNNINKDYLRRRTAYGKTVV